MYCLKRDGSVVQLSFSIVYFIFVGDNFDVIIFKLYLLALLFVMLCFKLMRNNNKNG